MKPKKIKQKLTLKKTTISDLNSGKMKNVYGGGSPTYFITKPWIGTCNKISCVVPC